MPSLADAAIDRAARRDAAGALAQFIASAAPVILTGAGMSTASGIPDYRGRDGVARVRPMQHRDFMRSAAARRRYWARSFAAWPTMTQATPNRAHQALAALQDDQRIGRVITQNVDGLDIAAGTHAIELHGALRRVRCAACGATVPRDQVQAELAAANGPFVHELGEHPSQALRPDGDMTIPEELLSQFVVPQCSCCGGDVMKPDVVFFGDNVPPERVAQASQVVAAASGLLVLGSSLAVMSGFRFVRASAKAGIPIAIVNHGATRGDDLAQWRLDAPLEQVLTDAVDLLT